jgi:hypothetical protein
MATVFESAFVAFGVLVMLGIGVAAAYFLMRRSKLNREVPIRDWLKAEGFTEHDPSQYEGLWRGFPVRLRLVQMGTGKYSYFAWVAGAQVQPHPDLATVLGQFPRLAISDDGWISYPMWSGVQLVAEASRDVGQVWQSLNDDDAYGGGHDHHARDALAVVVERARFAQQALGREAEIDSYGIAPSGWDGDRDADGKPD